LTWLDDMTKPRALYDNSTTMRRVHWDANLHLDNLPTVDYRHLLEERPMTNADGRRRQPVLTQLLANLLCYGFALIDNTPANLDDTVAATGVISFPQAIIRLHRMHEMQTTVTDDHAVCLSVCLSRGSTRRRLQCVRAHSMQPLSNHFDLFVLGRIGGLL